MCVHGTISIYSVRIYLQLFVSATQLVIITFQSTSGSSFCFRKWLCSLKMKHQPIKQQIERGETLTSWSSLQRQLTPFLWLHRSKSTLGSLESLNTILMFHLNSFTHLFKGAYSQTCARWPQDCLSLHP